MAFNWNSQLFNKGANDYSNHLPWQHTLAMRGSIFYQLYSFFLANLSIAKNSQQSTVRSLKFCNTSCPLCLFAQIELSLKQIWPQHFGWWQLLSFSKLSHTDTHKLISTMFSPFTPPRGSVTQMSTSVTHPWWCQEASLTFHFDCCWLVFANSPVSVSTFWWHGSCPTRGRMQASVRDL